MNRPIVPISAEAGSDAALAARSSGDRVAASHPQDLDSRILAAERAVIERDERVRHDLTELKERLHVGGGGASPGKVGAALAGGGTLALSVAKMLFSRGGRKGGGGSLLKLAGGRGSPLARLAPLVWPMLPAAVKSKLGPGTAAALLGFVVPLLSSAGGARAKGQQGQQRRAVEAAPRVDLRRFSGRWFEIARLPVSFQRHCDRDVMAHYTQYGHELRVVNRCVQRNGRVRVATGIGRALRGGNGAKLELSFTPSWLRWLPGGWEPYWVLRIDPDYRTALVGTPDRRCLWLLSRTPDMDDARYTAYIEHARRQGFKVSDLVVTTQTGDSSVVPAHPRLAQARSSEFPRMPPRRGPQSSAGLTS